jgi:hypothetical protein
MDMSFSSIFSKYFLTVTTATMLFVSSILSAAPINLPTTGTFYINEARSDASTQVSLQEFVEDVKDGNAKQIKGLYADDAFSLRVVQQPSGKPGFVSPVEGITTQFSMATVHNVTGMLAHNFSSGQFFFDLALDDMVDVVYGDGLIKEYQVTAIRKYQALEPKSSASDFIDLYTGEKISAAGLFNQMYTGKHHLTLQTCIQVGEEDSWGRLFVIAHPVEN